jgi:hypothetical protein
MCFFVCFQGCCVIASKGEFEKIYRFDLTWRLFEIGVFDYLGLSQIPCHQQKRCIHWKPPSKPRYESQHSRKLWSFILKEWYRCHSTSTRHHVQLNFAYVLPGGLVFFRRASVFLSHTREIRVEYEWLRLFSTTFKSRKREKSRFVPVCARQVTILSWV